LSQTIAPVLKSLRESGVDWSDWPGTPLASPQDGDAILLLRTNRRHVQEQIKVRFCFWGCVGRNFTVFADDDAVSSCD
jgi:hypothetical protein